MRLNWRGVDPSESRLRSVRVMVPSPWSVGWPSGAV